MYIDARIAQIFPHLSIYWKRFFLHYGAEYFELTNFCLFLDLLALEIEPAKAIKTGVGVKSLYFHIFCVEKQNLVVSWKQLISLL